MPSIFTKAGLNNVKAAFKSNPHAQRFMGGMRGISATTGISNKMLGAGIIGTGAAIGAMSDNSTAVNGAGSAAMYGGIAMAGLAGTKLGRSAVARAGKVTQGGGAGYIKSFRKAKGF